MGRGKSPHALRKPGVHRTSGLRQSFSGRRSILLTLLKEQRDSLGAQRAWGNGMGGNWKLQRDRRREGDWRAVIASSGADSSTRYSDFKRAFMSDISAMNNIRGGETADKWTREALRLRT